MENHLNLIKTDFKEMEKRVFPRFPFTYLTFKETVNDSPHAFEVKDISFTGMQICTKEGHHQYETGKNIDGTLHWRGQSLNTSGTVMWVSGSRVGLSFSLSKSFDEEVKDFLSVKNIVAGMRPIHQADMGLEIPADLKYWLQADGPVEIFVWRHNAGEVSRFNMIMMDSFIEWEDGKGLKSGKVVTKRDLDTPLVTEDEFLFQIDEGLCVERLNFAQSIVNGINETHLPEDAINFLKRKLGLAT